MKIALLGSNKIQFSKVYTPEVLEKLGKYGELSDRISKKNINEQINFTLLRKIGEYEVNVRVERKEIEIALDFYRDLFHL